MLFASASLAILALLWVLLSPRVNPKLYDRCMFKPDIEHGDATEFKQFLKTLSHSSEFFIKNRAGNRLHAWLLGDITKAPYVIFYSMGKDGDIARRARVLSLLLKSGLPVFIYEYSGFGASEGKPSVQTLCNDAVDAFDIVCSLGFAPEQIVLYGESLGTAISAELLNHRRPGALILKSGFASLVSIAKELVWALKVYPSWMFPKPRLDTCANLQGRDLPTLVVHGKGDRLARVHHAQLMHEAAGPHSQLLWLPDSRHAFMPDHDEQLLVDGVCAFLLALPVHAAAA